MRDDQGRAGVGALAQALVDRDRAQDLCAELVGQQLAAALAEDAVLLAGRATNVAMFSITPATFMPVCAVICPARNATRCAACCGVVTTSMSALGSIWASEMEMSPVPGGRSQSRKSSSPQCTSARNCCSARCSIGPRQMTGRSSLMKKPIEMTLQPCACRGMTMPSKATGWPDTPSIRGIE